MLDKPIESVIITNKIQNFGKAIDLKEGKTYLIIFKGNRTISINSGKYTGYKLLNGKDLGIYEPYFYFEIHQSNCKPIMCLDLNDLLEAVYEI